MFCKKCGKEIEQDAKFCQGCGIAFSSIKEEKFLSPISLDNKKSWISGKAIKSTLITLLVVGAVFLKFGVGMFNSVDNQAVDKNNNAMTAFDSGNSEQAISQFKQASNDALSNNTKRLTLVNLAYVYASEGKNDLSLKTFKEALPLASNDSFEYYLISGEIELLEKNPAKALSNYNKAYQINSSDFQINNALNLFYLNLDESSGNYMDYPKALVYAQKAYEVSEETIKNIAKQNLAIAYFFNEKYDQALPLFLSFDLAKDPYMSYWLGLTYLAKGDVNNGRSYLQKAKNAGVKIEPELSKYLY